MPAYGYIRKSVVHDPARTLSPATQEGAIRSLAARHGDDDVVILSDLDVSGRKKRDKRPGWDEFLRAVEDGEATAVYAYSLSRFARSVSQLAEFFDLCDRLKVPIRVERDQIDTSTATGKLVGNVLASLAQFESDVASERVRDAFASKRGQDPEWKGPGNRPYGEHEGEDMQAVVDAFREAGSYDAAARLLNERGFPTKYRQRAWSGPPRRAVWHGATVRDLVLRGAPELVSPGQARGAKAGLRVYRLSRLLECGTCHTLLTPSYDKQYDLVRYYCARARVTPHERKWVSEPKVLPVVVAEAGHAAFASKRAQAGSRDDEAKLAALADKRARVIDAYTDGVVDKAERDRRLSEVADSESKLSTRRWFLRIAVPPLIGDVRTEDGQVVRADDPREVNAYLRRLFARVVVEMKPPARPGPSKEVPHLDFEWRDPSLRLNVEE